MSSPTRAFMIGVMATLVLMVVTGAVFIYSGAYPMGADRPHLAVTEKLIEILRDRATEGAAASIVVPSLADPAKIAEGAANYDALCTGCHQAPGKSETSLRVGLYPQPPNLVEQGIDNPGESFWIIKHGIKMTAMPAWGKTYDDAQLWSIVAFLKHLPKVSPSQYAQWVAQGNASQARH